jgi:GT2 family glycosyltransferase
MQVIVVDNASGDGSAEMVASSFPWVRLIALDRNVGYAEGNNIGIAAALNTTGVESEVSVSDSTRAVLSSGEGGVRLNTTGVELEGSVSDSTRAALSSGGVHFNTTGVESEGGGFIVTLNPDVEFFDDSLRVAVEEMRKRPEVGAMGVRLVDPDGVTTQASLRSFPRPSAIVPEMLGLSRLLPGVFGQYRMHGFDYAKSQEVEQPMGTFVMYRFSALQQVSSPPGRGPSPERSDGGRGEGDTVPFDTQFPIFFNEVDLLQRIANAGWKIWYCAEARLKHHGGASTRQVRKPMIWESHRSLVRYYRKWYYRWWNAPLFWLFAGLVYLGAFVRAKGWKEGFKPT